MDLPSDARALLALAALVVLPALVLVRAPWTFVPALSVATWVVSAEWMGLVGGPRTRVLHYVIAASAALALLRLVRVRVPADEPPPWGPADAAVAAVAVSRLAPFAAWSAPPGTASAFTAATALLTAWHDGPPRVLEPLFPGLRAGIDGAAALAGDVLLLARTSDAPRAMLLVALAGEGLLVLALYAWARRLLGPPAAAVVSIAAAVAGIVAPGELPRATLAVALAVAASAAVSGGRGRAGAVAAGLLLAGALAAEAGTAAAAFVALAAAAVAVEGGAGWRGPSPRRLATTAAVGAVLALPAALRPPVAAVAFTAVALVPVVLAAAGAVVVRDRPPHRAGTVSVAALTLAAALSLVAETRASARVLLTPAERGRLMAVISRTRPLDAVCAEPAGLGLWVPAVTGRGTSPTAIPGRLPADRGPCVR